MKQTELLEKTINQALAAEFLTRENFHPGLA
jgi:hypothetical protein